MLDKILKAILVTRINYIATAYISLSKTYFRNQQESWIKIILYNTLEKNYIV